MAKNINLEDPTTWPDDPESLAKLADGVSDEAEEPETSEEPVKAKDDDATETDKSEDSEQGKMETTTDQGETEEEPEESTEGESEEKSGRDDDLKGIIKTLGEQNKSIADANAELLKEIRESKGAKKDDQPPEDDLTDDERARIESAKKSWGDDIAELVEGNIRLSKTNKTLVDQVRTLTEDAAARAEAESKRAETEIQNAISANPLMNAWQADTKDGKWFDRAVKLHHMLMESDPGYASQSWNDRFNSLTEKVHAVYGESPHKAKFAKREKPPKQSAEQLQAAAKEKVAGAKQSVPGSLSDMTGAESEEKTVIQKLTDMSDAELQDYFTNLATKNPSKFEETLRALS